MRRIDAEDDNMKIFQTTTGNFALGERNMSSDVR
jgi:hypothetical protein